MVTATHRSVQRAIPRLRRVLALYEGGVPVQEIMALEYVSRQRVYALLRKAQRWRDEGLI